MNYDILVLGTEQAGFDRAISAAQVGFRVAVIGGPRLIPSLDQMRCAALSFMEHEEISLQLWSDSVHQLAHSQMLVDETELESLGIASVRGQARFVSANSIEVTNPKESVIYHGREIILATGVRSWCPHSLHRDDKSVLCVESLMNLGHIPRSAIVVGAGSRGISAAVIMAALGAEVLIVDEDPNPPELMEFLATPLETSRPLNMSFRFGEEVIGTEVLPDFKAAIRLANGRLLSADVVLLCVGHEGCTDQLGLETAGVGLDEHGRVWCDEYGTSWAPHISVVGDLMGHSQKSGHRVHRLDPKQSLFPRNFAASAERIEAPVRSNGS